MNRALEPSIGLLSDLYQLTMAQAYHSAGITEDDACFHLFAGEKMSPVEVLAAVTVMFPEHSAERLDTWLKRFVKLFTQSIYKWVQSPISLHVGNLDLDRERAMQLPVVTRTEW